MTSRIQAELREVIAQPDEDHLAAAAADSILGANPFVGINRRDLRQAAAAWLGALLREPTEVVRVARSAGKELALVAAGRSAVTPLAGDRRFADPAFNDHPGYRRLMQAYLVGSAAARELVEEADLEPLVKRRAAFAMQLLTEAVAPTNVFLGNPAAIKQAFETAGLSLVRGGRNRAHDIRHNRGMPTQVDRRPFKVGETLAVSPGAVVYRDEVFELIQYAPARPRVRARAVLVVPPQVNKFYFADLAPGRSFFEHSIAAGQQVFTISWRNPTAAQRDWGLGTYVEACKTAIGVVCDITGMPDCNLVGFCAGGMTMAALLGHLAATGDERVHAATFAVTVLDLDTPSTLGLFVSDQAVASAAMSSRRRGVLEGSELAQVFAWMRPNDLVWNYWVNNYLLGKNPPAFDILAWNNDTTRLPSTFHAEMLDVLTSNALMLPGKLEVLGTPIDLRRPSLDTYVVAGITDHITPWRGCFATTSLMGERAQFVLTSSGHIQSLVSPPGKAKAHFFVDGPLGEGPDRWLAGAAQQSGSWWDHWLTWIGARSGRMQRAPAVLGNQDHPQLMAAPGRYVHQL